MTQTKKSNLFDQFDEIAQKTEGLTHLERTKISLTSEQRTKNVIAVVTPSEHRQIRGYCRDLEQRFDKRITVSDVSRELLLLLLGQESGSDELRRELQEKLRTTI
jgi:hypothetical protein